MSRGVLSGIVAGAAVSVLGMATLSLMAPIPSDGPKAGKPPAPAPVVEAPVTAPALETAPAPDSVPAKPEAPEPAPTATAPAAGAIEVPPGSEFNRPAPEGEAQLPTPDALPETAAAPEVAAPAAEGAPRADTAPASTPQAATAPETMQPPETDVAMPGVAAEEEPVLPSPEAASPEAPVADAAPSVQVEAPEVPKPVAEAQPEAEPEQPAPETDQAEVAPDSAPSAVVDLPGTGAMRVPVPGGGIAVPNVRTNRLPSIGGVPSEEPAVEAQDEAPRLGALALNAAPFTADPSKPLFSVILIDAGDKGLDREVLTTFSFPVTFAVDASRPDAAEAVADYRAHGFEVVLITGGLPEGAQPRDLETSMLTYLERVSQAVAVMDAETGGMNNDRPLLRQLANILTATGHGLVTSGRGLNTAGQIAASQGVPSVEIFRTLDEDLESVATIRRYLDRAAFKAAQDGHVVMLGHSYPNTVTALFAWALEGKGAEVELAPISAVLRAQ